MQEHNIYAKGAYGVIDGAHAAIHDGRVFHITFSEQINATEYVEVLLTVPAGVYPHFTVEIVAEKLAELDVFMDATYTSGGVSTTPRNRNLNSTTASGVTAAYVGSPGGTPIVHAAGTNVWKKLVTTTGKGGATRFDREIVGKAGSAMVFRLTSKAANSDVNIEVLWYEPR